AEEILERLEKAHPQFRRDEAQLLEARVLEAIGETNRSVEIYERLRATYVGFEAKYRYAVFLKRLGREKEAAELFDFIANNARRSALESEQEWVRLAQKEREATIA